MTGNRTTLSQLDKELQEAKQEIKRLKDDLNINEYKLSCCVKDQIVNRNTIADKESEITRLNKELESAIYEINQRDETTDKLEEEIKLLKEQKTSQLQTIKLLNDIIQERK